MNAYWLDLTERERWMVVIAALGLSVYLLYLLVFAPLSTAVHKKTVALFEKQKTLSWMEQIQREYFTKGTKQTLTNSQLLTLLATQLQKSSFQQFVYQLQQTGPGDIQLSFEKVPFHALIVWLSSWTGNYNMVIKQLSAERTNDEGLVKVMIIIATSQ
ncbi:MAG: type II secretion system protein GspM [Legionella sp.]